jgi:hypothetical protein
MLKVLVVYAHLIATCLAIGTVLTLDWRLFRARERVLGADDISRLRCTQTIASASLVFLWVSGLLLVWLGYAEQPAQYLTNQKLWAKVAVVMILTINGILLHGIAFPKIKTGTVLMQLAASTRMTFATMGGVSSVSWLFAAFLGIARPWNYTISFSLVIGIYGGLLLLAVAAGAVLLLAPNSVRAVLQHQPA